jgi:hypothetical protein
MIKNKRYEDMSIEEQVERLENRIADLEYRRLSAERHLDAMMSGTCSDRAFRIAENKIDDLWADTWAMKRIFSNLISNLSLPEGGPDEYSQAL